MVRISKGGPIVRVGIRGEIVQVDVEGTCIQVIVPVATDNRKGAVYTPNKS